MRFGLIWLLRYIGISTKLPRLDWIAAERTSPKWSRVQYWRHFIYFRSCSPRFIFIVLRCDRKVCGERPIEWSEGEGALKCHSRLNSSQRRHTNGTHFAISIAIRAMFQFIFIIVNAWNSISLWKHGLNRIGVECGMELNENWIDSPLTNACIDCTNLWTTQNQ